VVDPRDPHPHREAGVVSTVDLAPTLCALAGVTPPARMDGRSLAPAIHGDPLVGAPAFAETELWLSETPVRPGPSMRVPTPRLLDLLEVDPAHGNRLVVRADVEPVTILARHRMVRDDRWKLVYAPTLQGAQYQLFDTLEDPDELTDVLARQPAEATRLESLLWAWLLADPSVRRVGDYVVPVGHDLDQLVPGSVR
jgi:arylsulfatase A-like enzyme